MVLDLRSHYITMTIEDDVARLTGDLANVQEALRLLRDANRLQGRPMSAQAPTSNQLLTWNATAKKWEPSTVTKYTDAEAIAAVEGEATVVLSGTLTATSYGGITEANLLDKAATETVSGAYTFSGRLTASDFLNLGTATELTISTGAVTATQSHHTIDTQDDDASDILDTINGGTAGDILILSAASSERTIVCTDDSDNLRLAGDFSLTHVNDKIVLLKGSTTWAELSRSDNNT